MLLQALLAAALQTALPAADIAPPAAPVLVPAPPSRSDDTLLVDDLDAVRGGDGSSVALTEQALKAVNAGIIRADTVGSGAISVGAGAFGNFDGIGNFIMNTGHENNIQSSLSVTVTMAPTTAP